MKNAEHKTVAIIQSNYIPWKGYFDIIQNSDVFIFLDDVQYTRRDWRNRNVIKTPQELKWLTIPVKAKGRYANSRILEMEIEKGDWHEKHVNMIIQNYKSAPYFHEVIEMLQDMYSEAQHMRLLCDVNYAFIKKICQYLEITTQLKLSSEFFSLDKLEKFEPTERLLALCQATGATHYISGGAAKNYMDTSAFTNQNIKVLWTDYSNYPIYLQLYGKFEHGVSIIDMLMMLGMDTRKYLKGKDLI